MEMSRLPGRPAYEVWTSLDNRARQRFMAALRRCLRPPSLTWLSRQRNEASTNLAAARGVMPSEYGERAEQALARWEGSLVERPLLVAHCDLWLGNVMVLDEAPRPACWTIERFGQLEKQLRRAL